MLVRCVSGDVAGDAPLHVFLEPGSFVLLEGEVAFDIMVVLCEVCVAWCDQWFDSLDFLVQESYFLVEGAFFVIVMLEFSTYREFRAVFACSRVQ